MVSPVRAAQVCTYQGYGHRGIRPAGASLADCGVLMIGRYIVGDLHGIGARRRSTWRPQSRAPGATLGAS